MKSVLACRSHLLSVGVLAAAAVCALGCSNNKAVQAAPSQAGAPRQPRPVRVLRVEEQTVSRSVEVTGTLAAQEQVVLGLKVPGRVSELMVDLGDRVRKGQIIAKLDPTDLRLSVQQAQAALQQARSRLGLALNGNEDSITIERTSVVRQAQARLSEAKINRDRAQQLYDQKLIARSEYDTALAAYQVAESLTQDSVEEARNRQGILAQRRSELLLAEQQLADTVLRSPIDGAVFERTVSIGQYLAAGAPVATVVKLNPLRLRLSVPERSALGIRLNQPVRVINEEDKAAYTGRVARLSPVIQEANRTLLVEAEVPNERGMLRPGAFVRAQITVAGGERAMFVPSSALVTFAGIEKVMLVQDGKSLEKTVRTGRRQEEQIEIAEGLQPGQQVIVKPGNMIGGQPVVVQK